LSRHTPGSAMLIRFLDEPSANREQAGGFSRFGASPPYGVVKLPRVFLADFHFFVEQRSCQNIGLAIEQVYDHWDVSSCGAGPEARVGQGSLLSGMSGVTAQDARYASLKRNERAQSTNGL
jgi:hypothetical protein